ncbi:MAG: nicotinamide riboside transporter PnuC, partial [Bacteroidota bacterium]
MGDNGIYQSIVLATQQLTTPEVLTVLFGLIYVVLAARENIWCWFWGILSSGLWAYVTWFQFNLLADALLNLFYVVMGFIGVYQWQFGGGTQSDNNTLPITTLSLNKHLWILIGGGFLTMLTGYFFSAYTAAAATYLDSFTTVFAVVATFLTVRKVLENWLYWIVVDALYIYLYISREGYLFA